MKTYDVRVTREGRWWMVEIPDLDGLTQARRLGEAPLMAREWIALMTDATLDDVAVTVTEIIVDGENLTSQRDALVELRADIEARSQELSALTRNTARDLVAHGVPVRDVGEVLDVSPQRVSQLVNG